MVRLRIPGFLDAYQQSEIPNGISETEIERRLAEKNPKSVIMILDACRSLVAADVNDSQDSKVLKRGNDSGSRLLTARKPPPGFMVLYSASFGEQAVESFGTLDAGRNSLFTGVLRSELQRPGQTLAELADRTKLMVRAIATSEGVQQEPEYFTTGADVEDFQLVELVQPRGASSCRRTSAWAAHEIGSRSRACRSATCSNGIAAGSTAAPPWNWRGARSPNWRSPPTIRSSRRP